MRHRKDRGKLSRTTGHRRCLLANMLKDLIDQEAITTSSAKAKVLRRYADQMITLAKEDTLASRRQVSAKLMVRQNPLTSKEARAARGGDLSGYNTDRRVIRKLFEELGPRFKDRKGGYTRMVRTGRRVGDDAEQVVLEYLGG